MEKYTKEQLIEAMAEYNNRAINEPEKFSPFNDPNYTNMQNATASVEYLLKIVEEQKVSA